MKILNALNKINLKSKYLKIFIIIFICSLYLVLSLNKISFIDDNHDLGRHLANGKLLFNNPQLLKTNFYSNYFSEHSFVNHHWLTGTIFYSIFKISNYSGLIIFKGLLYLASFLLLFQLSRKKTSFFIASIMSPAILLAFLFRNDIRPEIFSCLFISIFLYILFFAKEKYKKYLWFLPLIQIIWVNTHIYFFLGPLFYLFFLSKELSLYLEEKPFSPDFKKLIAVGVAISIACFINPNGLSGAFYPILIFLNHNLAGNDNISTLALFTSGNPLTIIASFYMLMFTISIALTPNNQSNFKLLLSGSAIFLYIFAARNTGVALAISYPLLCINIKKINPKTIKLLFISLIIPGILLLYFNGYETNTEFGLGLQKQTLDTANFIKKNNIKDPIFNTYTNGSYLIWTLFPKIKPHLDNRSEAYPRSVWINEYKPARYNPSVFNDLVYIYKFKACIIDTSNQQLLTQIFSNKDWGLVHIDKFNAVFVKNTAYPKLFQTRITKNNALNKLSKLYLSEDIKSITTSTTLLRLLGHTSEAIKIIKHFADYNKSPNAYFLLGTYAYSFNKNLYEAQYFYTKAIKAGHPRMTTYDCLATTYHMLGNNKKAVYYCLRSLLVTPHNKTTWELLFHIKNHKTPHNLP